MIRDFRKLAPGSELRTDVCIIGAGPAGISLARELADTPLDVCLLESGGGPDWVDRTQELSRGADPHAGWPYEALEATRVRIFGGTSTVWEGACLPLDPLDFRSRPWVPSSGWPISWSSLGPYYERAAEACQLGSRNHGPEVWEDFGVAPLALDPRRIEARFWQYSPPTHFGPVYERDLAGARNVHVYLYANVTSLEASANGRALAAVKARSFAGNEVRVRARHYVLACGGIENARLLLNSDDVVPRGVGNQGDLVGRHFMEHTYYHAGFLAADDHTERTRALRHLREDGVHALAGLRLSDALQTEERILNCCGLFDARFRPPDPGTTALGHIREQLRFGRLPPDAAGKIADVLTNLDSVLPALYGEVVHGSSTHYEPQGTSLMVQAEQAPDPENRVTLGAERDELGLRRVDLTWRLGELERRTVEVAARRVAAEVTRLGIGRVRLADWVGAEDEADWRDGLRWGHHHMGTTRMSHDPATGVVNADCRMHHVDNLYVAGSSVFPTGGYANPTLTIVALAIRLADHLKSRAFSAARG